ncbi:MAG: hypothetical protein LBG76_05840 [Treponema sp.]|jgi:tetratricopeptide (TPR) repeat protein|nr:hypothetical protein [Treponema sp.]
MSPKRLWTVCAFLLLLAPRYWAQQKPERPYWFALEQGKLAFRSGAYGEALLAFEDARAQRRSTYTRMEEDLVALLSISEVRRLGDNLELIETYIAGKNYVNAGRALEEIYYRIPKTNLENSAQKALAELGRLKDYPEAEYWIGETYRAEGELSIAIRQYQKAYEQRGLLENPAFAPELLYKMAEAHRLRQEYTEMERRLVEILAGDSLWSEDTDSFVRNAMTRTLETGGINQFMTLYRYNNAGVLRAHTLLGFYYYATGRHSRAAEHLIFAFLIQNTILIEELNRIQYDYSFTTINELIDTVVRMSSLSAYIEEIEYFKTAYYLGTAFFGIGKTKAAQEFWDYLSRNVRAGEWRGRAVAQLMSPYVEKALEMP